VTDMRSPDVRPSASLGVLRWLAVAGLGLVGFGVLVLVAMSELSAPVRARGLVELVPVALGAVVGLVYLAAAFRLARGKQRLGVAIGWGLLLITFVVIILPDLHPPHFSANESPTIRDLRALVAAPSTANAGLAEPIRWGYRRTLHLPAASATASQSRSFAITAAPVKPGRSGVRGFCADTTGVLCFNLDGTAPPVRSDGTCDIDRCRPLE
jgi:hypothetical protein